MITGSTIKLPFKKNQQETDQNLKRILYLKNAAHLTSASGIFFEWG